MKKFKGRARLILANFLVIAILTVLACEGNAQVKIHMVGNFIADDPLGCQIFEKLAEAQYEVEFVGTRKEQIPQDVSINSLRAMPEVYHDFYDSVSVHQANKNMGKWLSSIPTPHISILHLGANDISAIVGGSSETSMFENLEAYEKIIGQIRSENPRSIICISKIIPAKSVNTSHNMVINAWNNEMDSLALKLSSPESRIRVIDLSSDLDDSDFKTHFDLNADGVAKTVEKLSKTLMSTLDAMGPTSIKEASIGFDIYPQPAHNQLNITTKSGMEPRNLKVYDSQGRLVMHQEQGTAIDVSSLDRGFYSIQFLIGNRQFSKKVLVQ